MTKTMTKEQAYETGVYFGFSSFPYNTSIQGLPDYLLTGPLAAAFARGLKEGFDYWVRDQVSSREAEN